MVLQRSCEQAASSSQDPLEAKENYILTFGTSVGYATMRGFLKTIGQITVFMMQWLHAFYLQERLLMKFLINLVIHLGQR